MSLPVRVNEPQPKADRRRAILDAAFRFWQESSIEQFTLGALAERLGVAKATLYLHYETREELLLEMLETMVEGWLKELSTWLAAQRRPLRPRQVAELIGRSLQSRSGMIRLMGFLAREGAGQKVPQSLQAQFLSAAANLNQLLPRLSAGDGLRFFNCLHALVVGLLPLRESFESPGPALVGANPRLPESPVDDEFLVAIEVLLDGFIKRYREPRSLQSRK